MLQLIRQIFVFFSAFPVQTPLRSRPSLELLNPPHHPRPYVIRHYAPANGVVTGNIVFRFPVTGPASDNEFTLVGTNGPGSEDLVVLPHIHKTHYESFYNIKGRVELWTQHGGNTEQQARSLTQGDFGAAPTYTNHTLRLVDPDTELLGVVVPGGFEDMFYYIGDKWDAANAVPYDPSLPPIRNPGTNHTLLDSLERFDVWSQLDFVPRRDLINGAAPACQPWHRGFNPIANDSDTAYFVANGFGPKYLDRDLTGFWQLVQPLITPEASGNTTFSMATISMSGLPPRRSPSSVPSFAQPNGCAFSVVEGRLTVTIEGYDSAHLGTGDVVFIPKETKFTYYSQASFTKVLYVSGGSRGIDQQLIQRGEWVTSPMFPAEY
ncbi:RmlC-like cupin domain-containing protein [Dactylonectria macrodidyma]|uniref:RmlC-like cupin domain-containing protein n=1 Tax=Dactylonectria macrodidyma TaxID=307937 RepID=A0A9P9EQC1_9HYPO|nr:RmlC-like cupin domain-containing protein [Dactylonectria macrodidyma]